ncbi:MAG: polysaccharide lyase 6 family protein [Qipengyuania sp.]|nr:polysaccharide lyase 6 family protein [Qipengyuania sp.]
MLKLGILWLVLVGTAALPLHAEEYRVRDQSEYVRALKQVRAGDAIILANGEWHDFELVITGKGMPDKPIMVRPEEAGKVFLTGQSSLRIGGEHIHVSGLVFKDGHSPRGEVIAFRRGKDDVARNSRVTEVVIDRFSKPDRFDDDYWVGLYGRNNRFDHNHLVGKTNQGVTLAVRLDSEESRENGHRIDHNYFGPRPVLGSNGGETIRIGTSQYSMFRSGTIVENNVFDRCDGEVEIISSKSNGNVFRENLFLRSRGTLTLRHGDDALVERNVFLGQGKDYTGGIRVINRNQTVRGNYMEGLRGTAFSSALTVMNGVPNSPVNRYVQVDDALIETNTVVDSTRVTLAGGASAERSAPPVNSVMRKNLFVASGEDALFRIEDDISGIAMQSNVLIGSATASEGPSLERKAAKMVRAANGLLYPDDPALEGIGAPRDLKPMELSQVGVAWYAKPGEEERFGASGKVHHVTLGEDTLALAADAAGHGDVLMLAPGDYVVHWTIGLDKTLTIRGAKADNRSPATIRFTRPSLVELREGGNLQLANLTIDGELAPDSVGNAVIRTTAFPLQSNMRVEIDGVSVRNLTVNKSFNVLTLGKGTLADRVSIRNSAFADISGAVVAADSETDDYGRYNVEYLDIVDSQFANLGGPIATVYRGGTDESTFGPFVTITGNAIANVGKTAGASILLQGVQTAEVARNALAASAPIRIAHTVGTPSTRVSDNTFAGTPQPEVQELNYEGPVRVQMSGNVFDAKDPK